MSEWTVEQPKLGSPGDPLGQRGFLLMDDKRVVSLYNNALGVLSADGEETAWFTNLDRREEGE